MATAQTATATLADGARPPGGGGTFGGATTPKKQQPPDGQKTIRVVDAKRALADITLLSAEELRTILESLVLEFDPTERQAILALEQVAADLKALRDRSPAGGDVLFLGPQSAGGPPAEPMDEVALRQLLYSPAVIPVVASTSGDTTASGPGAIRVRPGIRKPALALNTAAAARERRRHPYLDVAVAAEQAIVVEGISLDPSRQGGLIVDVFAGDVRPGLRAMADSGTFAAPVFSVVLAQHDPGRGPRLTPDSGGSAADTPVHPYSPEYVRDLRAQLGAALAFHLSGAGAYYALAEALRIASRSDSDQSGIGDAIVRVAPRGAETKSRSALEEFVGKLAEVFTGSSAGGQAIVASPEEFIFVLTPLLDIYRVGAFGAYYYALAEGPDSLGARRFLERAAIVRAEENQLAELDREIFAEIAKARHFAIIIEDKLGGARLREISAALTTAGASLDDPEAILALLRKRENEIVTTEYENRRLEWEAQVDNKCPHVRLAYRLRAARSAKEAMEILKKLSAYFKTPQARQTRAARGAGARPAAELEWILCKNCGFRVICPHVNELIPMEARNLPYDTIRTRLMKYAVQYSDRPDDNGGSVATTYSYFCRICSERLAEFIEEDRTAEILGAVGNLDDYVKKVIWIEAVNAAELVRFPMPIDPRQFASTAVDICHPLLLMAEGNLLKRGRRAATKPRGQTLTADDPFGDEETIDPRTHLYIALFVYAYVLNLIRSSHEASKAQSRRLGFEGVRPGAKMSTYAEAILSAVLKKYSGLISQIEDITPEYIADRFREAYRLVVGEEGPQELTTADEAKIVVNEVVTLSPTYHYIAIAARVFGKLPVERPLTPEAARREFETVLGRTLPAILEDRATDSKSELVQMLLGVRPTSRGSRRVAVEYPRGADPLYVYGAPEVNFLHKMSRVPAAFEKKVNMKPFDELAALAEAVPACGERCVVEAVGGRAAPKKKSRGDKKKSRGDKKAPAEKPRAKKAVGFNVDAFLRTNPILAAAESGLYLESYRLFTEYTVDVVDAATMEEFWAHLDDARTRERGFLLKRAATAVKNYRQYGFKVSRRYGLYGDPRPADRQKTRITVPNRGGFKVPLTYLYDENGLRHTWATGKSAGNIYIYEGGAGKKKTVEELTLRDIVSQISAEYAAGESAGPIHGRTLVDVKCSVCGVLLSEIHTLDEAKAHRSLEALAEFDAFFAFYDSRCPVEGMHDFGGVAEATKRTCSKCEMVEVLIFGYNSPKHAAAARAYYDKYLDRYREQRSTATGASADLVTDPAHDLSDPAAAALEKYSAFAEKWKHDYSLLVRAAELADAPVAALETLGATEGREYPDVLSGAGAPPPPSSLDDPRLLAVDSDVRVFTTAYNRLRFVGRFSKTPPDVEAILERAQVPKHEYESLAAHLPEIYDDYHAKRLALLQLRSPEDVLLFSIESLARMALAVAAAGGKGGSKPAWVSRLGKEFAQHELREIIRSERLLAKNGPFNFKIFGEEDIGGGSLGGVDEPADDFGDVGEDVLEAIEAGGGEDGAENPFSLEAVDIDDEDPNLEPE